MNNRSVSRRTFLKDSTRTAVGAATLASLASSVPARGANEKFTVGFVGCGGRGGYLADLLLSARTDVEISHVCDPDSGRMDGMAARVAKKQGKEPTKVGDFRRILDEKGVDAIFNITPDHWHALPTIRACQAGKDVYFEKPASHNIWEGQQMVKAARKYNRVVQMGSQCRSAPYIMKAIEYIRSGKLGGVHLVKVFNQKDRPTIGKKPDGTAPKGVNYDMWLGGAPGRPFNPNRFHYNWHWFWDYSGGDIINDGVHQMDIARWMIGQDYPTSVVCSGGIHHYNDDQECPDTQYVAYDFDKLTLVFEQTLWTPYMDKISQDVRNNDLFPNWYQCATRIEMYGTKGVMFMARHGGGWQVFEKAKKQSEAGVMVAQEFGRIPEKDHLENFFSCIKSRGLPNADILQAHRSTILCHLGNISYRLGGRRLTFDGKTETIVNDTEAQQLAKRVGREPYAIPENV